MSGIETINPQSVKAQSAGKVAGVGKDFNAFLGAAEAFAPAGATAGQMYSSPNAQAVLSAAFSGVSTLNAQTGGATGGYAATSAPSLAFGGGVAAPGGMVSAGYKSNTLVPGANNPVVPGANGFSQGDLINSMHQNSLQLLELQATMQSHLQESNTKSNILSADHRARMAMIEKFTAR